MIIKKPLIYRKDDPIPPPIKIGGVSVGILYDILKII